MTARLALEDLDRDELLALLQRRRLVSFSAIDLWNVRWDSLSRRALAASEAEGRASSAYHDALIASVRRGVRPREAMRLSAEAARLRRVWQAAKRRAQQLRAAEEAAWAALEAA